VFLLTETAPAFFARFGFTDIDRARVPETIRQTVEFSSACPASARVMVLDLASEPEDQGSRVSLSTDQLTGSDHASRRRRHS
jgi:hypothetical protein